MTTPAITITAPNLPGAACAGHPDPDLWFRHDDEPAAARICATCPLRTACQAWALREDERDGVWGGLTEADRWRIRKGYTA